MASFYDTVRAAVADLTEHGFDSVERVRRWTDEIERAARESLIPERRLEEELRATLQAIYRREIDRGGVLSRHPGVGKFTIQQVAPRLHSELERRLSVSADLIKLNRTAAIERTKRRWVGWAESVPIGGTDVVNRTTESVRINSSLKSLPFEERRVAIDQGHKFVSSLSAIIAHDGGAIAAIWRSHWRQRNYDYREDHKERDLRIYLVRGSWALERGLIKPGPDGYTDDITQPGEEVSCRCYYTYLYAISKLPVDMITREGHEELERVRREMAA